MSTWSSHKGSTYLKPRMATSKKQKRPGILDALITIMIDPSGTIFHLLDNRRWPPHILLLLILFSLICVAPPFLYSVDGVTNQGNLSALGTTLITILFTLVLSSGFFTVLISTLKAPVRWVIAFGTLVYALTPITVSTAAVYFCNYLTTGYLSIVQSLAFGGVTHRDWVVSIFPYTFKLSGLLGCLILAQGSRVLCRTSLSSGILLGAFYIPLLMGSFVVCASTVEVWAPSSSEATIRFFRSFFEIR